MAYKITIDELGFSDSIAIAEEEFLRIRKAKKAILRAIALEEKLDHVLENFADLERELLNMALEHSIFPGKIDDLLGGGAHLVNRRIVNLLTTTRLYLDQVMHDLSEIFGKDSEQYKAVKQSIRREYDSVLSYRVMEELRNHAQHRSLPTHVISFGATWDKSPDLTGLRFYVVPSIEVLVLQEDPKFKKAVLKELTEAADEKGCVNLLPSVRQYVEALGRIHHGVREVTAPQLSQADKLIAEYCAKGKDRFGSVVGLFALDSDAQGRYAGMVHLTERFTERRKGLEKKNRPLGLMSRRYVSSRV